MLLVNYTQKLTKLIKIGQNNSVAIKNIMDKQERLEKKFDKQNTQILEILTLLKDREPEIGQKNKGIKKADKFYQVNINWLYYYFFTLFIFAYN